MYNYNFYTRLCTVIHAFRPFFVSKCGKREQNTQRTEQYEQGKQKLTSANETDFICKWNASHLQMKRVSFADVTFSSKQIQFRQLHFHCFLLAFSHGWRHWLIRETGIHRASATLGETIMICSERARNNTLQIYQTFPTLPYKTAEICTNRSQKATQKHQKDTIFPKNRVQTCIAVYRNHRYTRLIA